MEDLCESLAQTKTYTPQEEHTILINTLENFDQRSTLELEILINRYFCSFIKHGNENEQLYILAKKFLQNKNKQDAKLLLELIVSLI